MRRQAMATSCGVLCGQPIRRSTPSFHDSPLGTSGQPLMPTAAGLTAVGIKGWPEVPRGESWKEGVLRRIGWPHSTPQEVAMAWRRILRSVTSYADLEPELLGRVEELIDFVTAPGA